MHGHSARDAVGYGRDCFSFASRITLYECRLSAWFFIGDRPVATRRVLVVGLAKNHDFYVTKASAFPKDRIEALVNKLTPKICSTSGCNCAWVTTYVAACQSSALSCLRRLHGEEGDANTRPIRNEQELCYAVGGTIMWHHRGINSIAT